MNTRKEVAWVGHNLVVVENTDNVLPEPTGDGLTLAMIIQEGFNQR